MFNSIFFLKSWIKLCVEVLHFFRTALHTYIKCPNCRYSLLSFVRLLCSSEEKVVIQRKNDDDVIW